MQNLSEGMFGKMAAEFRNIIDNVYVWTHAIWLAVKCEAETPGLFEKQMAYETWLYSCHLFVTLYTSLYQSINMYIYNYTYMYHKGLYHTFI